VPDASDSLTKEVLDRPKVPGLVLTLDVRIRARKQEGERSMAAAKISMRGFAEVSCAAPNRKQATLKRYSSPTSGESVGRSNYYIRALSLIRRHHKGDSAYVTTSILKLLAEAKAESVPRKRTKLLSNHRAIVDYLKHFGARNLTIKSGKKLYYVFENLVVSAQPDLVAEEDGNLILIKLNLGRKDYPGGVSAMLLHLLYEAAQVKGLPVEPTGVECLQTSSGSKTAGPKKGFSDKQALNAQCQAILALWDDEG
jgi:hypothetical protein